MKNSSNWTMFTFMAGDGGLSDSGVEDLEEMEITGTTNNTRCLVEFDSRGSQFNGYDGTIRYMIPEKNDITNKANRIVLERLKEKDSGDPKTLVDSLKWVTSQYYSDHYLINLWNHGSGWRDDRIRSPIPAINKRIISRGRSLFKHKIHFNHSSEHRYILLDESTGNFLDMLELSNAIKEAGFSEDNKIDVLGFDACLMNMLEVAYEVKPYAKVVVGSEELEPATGWPYALDLSSLNNSNGNSIDLAKNLVNNYYDFYKSSPYNTDEYWPVTQSALDMENIEYFAESYNNFALEIKKLLESNKNDTVSKLRRIRQNVQVYAPSHDYDDYMDGGHFLFLCRKILDIDIAKIDAALNNLKKVVVSNVHLGDGVKNSNGITIWFPENYLKYQNYKSTYEELSYTKKYDGWNKLLDLFYSNERIE